MVSDRFHLHASQFVEDLLAHGRHTFTAEEARRRLRVSPGAAYLALRRLAKAGRLVMPRSGFYVIVDPQHRAAGTLPPEWFVGDLLRDIGRPYYVGLLSAAQVHGAAHHRPQEFQVVVPGKAIRPISAGNVRFRFFGKGLFERSAVAEVKTPTGYMRVSTPETTAWDLVRYAGAAGGIANVATVLSELGDRLDARRLLEAVRAHGDLPVAQRLGYLLDRAGHRRLTGGVAEWVARRGAAVRRLDPSEPGEGASASRKWRLLVNVEAEAEA